MTCALGKGLIIGREREATGSGSALRLLLLETSESQVYEFFASVIPYVTLLFMNCGFRCREKQKA